MRVKKREKLYSLSNLFYYLPDIITPFGCSLDFPFAAEAILPFYVFEYGLFANICKYQYCMCSATVAGLNYKLYSWYIKSTQKNYWRSNTPLTLKLLFAG